jgi:hypothetical protein
MLFSRILDETGLLGKRPGFLALLEFRIRPTDSPDFPLNQL